MRASSVWLRCVVRDDVGRRSAGGRSRGYDEARISSEVEGEKRMYPIVVTARVVYFFNIVLSRIGR